MAAAESQEGSKLNGEAARRLVSKMQDGSTAGLGSAFDSMIQARSAAGRVAHVPPRRSRRSAVQRKANETTLSR